MAHHDAVEWGIHSIRLMWKRFNFLDTYLVQIELFFFELNGCQHSVARVLAFRVVEHFDVFEHVLSCGFTGWVCAPPDPFPFQKLEEALDFVAFLVGSKVGCYSLNLFDHFTHTGHRLLTPPWHRH